LKNKVFPNWAPADYTLNDFINEHFGIYLSRPTENTGYITFLPEDKLAAIIPCEAVPIFNERARAFTNHLNPILKKRGTLNNVSDSVSHLKQERIIKKRFMKFFRFYNRTHHKSVIRELKIFLGIASLDIEGTRAQVKLNFTN